MRRAVLVSAALAAAVLAVYWRVLGHEFIGLDDPSFITSNPAVRNGPSWGGLLWAFGNDHWSWHPLTWLSHQLDCRLFGLDPTGHHAGNLLLHIANTILLFAVLRQLTGSFWKSAAVAAVFALHPLRVESVAWAAERKGLLSTLFGLLAIGAYVRYARRPEVGRYVLVAALFALCLLSKAMWVTLPFLLLILDFWPLGRCERPGAIRRLVVEKLPLLLMSTAVSILALRADPESIPLSTRAANAVVSYSRYLEKTFWPFDLALPYPYPEVWPWPRILLAIALVAAVSAFAVAGVRRRPYVAVGWLWFCGTLVPVIGIVQSGVQSMADRFTYVPMIGILVALAWLGADRIPRGGIFRKLAVLGFAILLAGLAVRSHHQLGYWRDTVTLFSHVTRVTEENYRAQSILGAAFLEEGDMERAHLHYAEALRIGPDEPEAHLGMGNLLAVLGEHDRARSHIKLAVDLDPGDPLARTGLGFLLLRTDRKAAEAQYRAALELVPDHPVAHFHLGTLRALEGDDREAVAHLETALRADPSNREARLGLAMALLRLRRIDAAVERLSASLERDPEDLSFLLPLARLLAVYDDSRIRDGARALELARTACELTGYRSAPAVDVLAAALAELGRYEEAAVSALDAARLAEEAGDASFAEEARLRAELYRQGVPYRQR